MDPSSDPSLHFHHHHRQGQRMPPSQPAGSMSPPPGSHPQGPSSPPASTAASSNPFVRSHHDELPAPLSGNQSSASDSLRGRSEQPRSALNTMKGSTSLSRDVSESSASHEGEISVAIKCPSLDQDSAVVRVRLTDTVLALKQTIQATWPGAPRAEGMRCIRSGRILSDTEVFSQLTEADATDDDVPPSFSSTSTHVPSSYRPAFEPYFSEPGLTTARSALGVPPTDHEEAVSGSSAISSMYDPATGQDGADAYAMLEDILRVTAPDNWPLLVEALKEAYDEYVLIYERIYNAAHAAQKGGASASATHSDGQSTQSELLASVETTLLGWDPVQVPDGSAAASAASSSTGNEARYLYQQVSHRGLPYLLRISTTPLTAQRSEALSTLLERITTLGTMVEKLENVIMLGRLIQVQRPASSSPAAGAETAQLNGAAAAGRAMALEQGGIVAGMTRIAQRAVEACREITVADATAVIVPMAFVGFKVGILLSIVLRGEDTLKRYFVLGMASVYVVFESYRIVQRRMRVRQRMAPRVPAPAPPQHHAQQQGDGQAGTGDAGAPPAGANVPAAPSHEEQVERQATQEPLRPLPPPQAPARIAARTRLSLDWCIDHMAFLGLDAEDAELGLLPAPGAAGTAGAPARSWVQRVLTSEWMLPALLFVFTMMPAVEQRRKRAIEERERVIRKWARLEHERRQRVQDMMRAVEEKTRADHQASVEQSGSAPTMPVAGASAAEDLDLQRKRAEYAERMLRQRRTTEAVDMDDDDAVARRVARQMQDDDEMEDMNVF
ncbi:conserved hypothetical protein [Sporisorium reilianum SRZ2]|uniref:Ubiquitin-like domain-containing protein n=1 Tax=Sporisorium reilianum (strain SRZ2) TaxID=999809 RepID=E6ZR80_SPORE|nr:conserved hypothetical protein [Sporisorium reilianum SRZ2]